jgi:pilus assembly protein CpaE
LQRIVTVAIRNTAAIRNGETAKPGVPETLINPATATVIAVMGVKGGVGATTVAMNVAATLVGRGRVVLAEIRPGFGSLQGHFCPGRLVRGLTSLLDSDPQAPVARAVTSVLWPVPTVSGLRVLFGPQTEADCREMGPAQITAILQALAAEADFVVVDLPVSLFEANRAILAASHYLALVLEPAPACMKLGKLIVEGIQSWEKTPASIGAVIVNRTSEGAPVPITEIEAELGVPVIKAVPPAPDLYLQGERAHAPMVLCDPDSLVADSFVALARSFHSCGALYNRAS